MSYTNIMALVALEGPVTSAGFLLVFGQKQSIYKSKSHTGLQASDSLIFSLLLVSFGDDWRNVAASCRVAVLSLHSEKGRLTN